MPASLEFVGMDELRDALRQLPAELTADAKQEIDAASASAARDIEQAYPTRTGRLRAGVSVRTVSTGPYAVKSQVRSDAPYAAAYEKGTVIRTTRQGYNRGKVNPNPVTVPIMIRSRAVVMETLIAIVERAGLSIRG